MVGKGTLVWSFPLSIGLGCVVSSMTYAFIVDGRSAVELMIMVLFCFRVGCCSSFSRDRDREDSECTN